jgi:hypothetical protein
MPYIGRGISQLQTIDKLDAITPSTSTGAGPYNLTQSSSAFTPISANNLLISINGVVQYGNFTVSGSTVTFTGALSDSDTCNFILHVGEGVVNTPGAGTVTSSSIVDGSIVGDDINSTFDISSKTVTLPASVSGLGTGITNAQLAGSIANSKLANSSITINGSAVSLGSSTTIATGIEWQSTIVTGTTHTASAGQGIWIDTTSNACNLTLPGSPSVGNELIFSDFARKWGINAVTLTLNGSKFQGNTSPAPVYDTAGETVHIVYSGSTQGWIPINDGAVAFETPQTYSIDFLVVAGGGGGGSSNSGGGGGGGMRTSTQTIAGGTTITCTVGAGGSGATSGGSVGSQGSSSSISGTGVTTITSAGGGFGGASSSDGGDGGAGGGAGYNNRSGGSGNTPSTSPSQGADGGNGVSAGPGYGGGGGGGGGASGVAGGVGNSNAGAGGDGSQSSITGSAVYYAGGGGGTGDPSAVVGAGGQGGGGAGNKTGTGVNGTANTGGGGGATQNNPDNAGSGGTGVVILSVPSANYSGTITGSPTVTTSGSNTIIKFTGSGTYVT